MLKPLQDKLLNYFYAFAAGLLFASFMGFVEWTFVQVSNWTFGVGFLVIDGIVVYSYWEAGTSTEKQKYPALLFWMSFGALSSQASLVASIFYTGWMAKVVPALEISVVVSTAMVVMSIYCLARIKRPKAVR